jgi:hypothetical protein
MMFKPTPNPNPPGSESPDRPKSDCAEAIYQARQRLQEARRSRTDRPLAQLAKAEPSSRTDPKLCKLLQLQNRRGRTRISSSISLQMRSTRAEQAVHSHPRSSAIRGCCFLHWIRATPSNRSWTGIDLAKELDRMAAIQRAAFKLAGGGFASAA